MEVLVEYACQSLPLYHYVCGLDRGLMQEAHSDITEPESMGEESGEEVCKLMDQENEAVKQQIEQAYQENQRLIEQQQREELVATVDSKSLLNREKLQTISLERLQDFDYLLSNFYYIHSSTDITSKRLDVSKLLSIDLTMEKDASKPQILIYHTHPHELFINTKEGDRSRGIVGVGERLKVLLEECGYQVIHIENIFEGIEGTWKFTDSYTVAEKEVKKILEKHPSIQVVIDLHRDGTEGTERIVTEVDGKKMAKLMFFNGISYSNTSGEITHLPNPNLETNLAMSLRLKLLADQYYPDFTKKIFLKNYRFNMHLVPKYMLIECGDNNNTYEDVENAMEPLAQLLNCVLSVDESAK